MVGVGYQVLDEEADGLPDALRKIGDARPADPDPDPDPDKIHVDGGVDDVRDIGQIRGGPHAVRERAVQPSSGRRPPPVVPTSPKNLAFISQFAEMPFDIFTEQYSVRCAQIAVYRVLGIPESRLTELHRHEKSPRVLAKAAVTMFR